MPIENGDILRAATKILTLQNTYSMNVWWFRATGTGTADEWDTASTIETAIEAYMGVPAFAMKVGTTFPEMLIDQVAWEEAPAPAGWKVQQTIWLDEWGESFVPSGSGDNMPGSDAVLIKLITTLRKHSGRKYLGPFPETENVGNGLVSGTLVTNLGTAAGNLLNDYAVPNSSISVHFVVPNMAGNATNEINSILTSNIWRDQRRRQDGVGI